MKNKISKILSLTIMTGLLIATLTACGKSKSTSVESSNTMDSVIPPSKAFAEEGIWFHSDSPMVTKDEKVDYTLVFDGDGNVTRYTTNFTYADLRDLSNEEILELAKKQDKELFESTMQQLLSDIEYSKRINRIDLYNQLSSAITKAQYQEPKSYPFTLKAITDGTGNETVNEILLYTYCTWNTFILDETTDPETWNAYNERDGETELFVSPSKMTVVVVKRFCNTCG